MKKLDETLSMRYLDIEDLDAKEEENYLYNYSYRTENEIDGKTASKKMEEIKEETESAEKDKKSPEILQRLIDNSSPLQNWKDTPMFNRSKNSSDNIEFVLKRT